MNHINALKFTTGIGSSPAAIDIRTGLVYINSNRIGDFSANMWEWLLEHENAHKEYQTGNELFVDRIAFNRQCFKGKSMKQIIQEAQKFLLWSNPDHKKRLIAMLNHGKAISLLLDKHINYNYKESTYLIAQAMEDLLNQLEDEFELAIAASNGAKALEVIKQMEAVATTAQDLREIVEAKDALRSLAGMENVEFGGGKKGEKEKKTGVLKKFLAKKEERKDKRLEIKAQTAASKAEARIVKANAKVIDAQNGGGQAGAKGQNLKNILGAVSNVAGAVTSVAGGGPLGGAIAGIGNALTGGGGTEEAMNDAQLLAEQKPVAPQPEEKKTSVWLIVGAVVGGVLLIGGLGWAIYKAAKK